MDVFQLPGRWGFWPSFGFVFFQTLSSLSVGSPSQRAVLREPSADDPAADEPLRPVGLPERRPVPDGGRRARLPLPAGLLRQQVREDDHRPLPGSGRLPGAGGRQAPPHRTHILTGLFTFSRCPFRLSLSTSSSSCFS